MSGFGTRKISRGFEAAGYLGELAPGRLYLRRNGLGNVHVPVQAPVQGWKRLET
jgi:hypothetical protein